MPVTRSHTVAEACSTSDPDTHTDLETWDFSRSRVHANPRQLTVLNALYDVSRSRTLLKGDYLRTAAETGLTEQWIRSWLTRKKSPRYKSKATATSRTQDESSGATGNASSSSQSDASFETAPASLASESTDTSSNDTGVCLLELLNAVSSHSISALRSDISRAHFAPELYSSGVSMGANPALNYGHVYTQLLGKSPSLGFIPATFPSEIFKELSQPVSPGSSSASASTCDAGVSRSPQAGDVLPAIPNLNLSSAETNGRISSIPSLLEFVQDAHLISKRTIQTGAAGMMLSRLPPSPFVAPSSDVSFGLNPTSFAPSMQSHSTSVMLSGAPYLRPQISFYQSLPFQPLPVAFKMRLSDLSMLSKRVKAISSDDLTSVEGSIDGEGSYTSDSSLDSILSNQAISDTDNESNGPLTPA